MAFLGNNLAAAIAFNRFGLGGRPDDAVPGSPAGWLVAQLAGPDPYQGVGMPSTATGLALYAGLQNAKTAAGQALFALQIQQLLSSEVAAFLTNAITTRAPFRERLVWFWTNHFALMATHNDVACCAGAFVREAIRPHVNGTVTDMLLAVMQHPAMLFSLNNVASAGPQSQNVLRCQATGCTTLGINENLARECLELHTVGLAANYTQADVDALAMLLTGWTVAVDGAPAGFRFNASMHQPGTQTVLGQSFPGTQAGCVAALTYLATHPATYQHLATELVTHFVSDTPAAADIATVAQALAASGGNLGAAATAVVNLASAWQCGSKIRAPMDYVVAVLRAAGATGAETSFANVPANAVCLLGAPVWQPPFPNGYSDLTADWAGAAQMVLRADWINTLCASLPGLVPASVAGTGLGPLENPATIAAVASAASPHDQLALLFLSPEFQRR